MSIRSFIIYSLYCLLLGSSSLGYPADVPRQLVNLLIGNPENKDVDRTRVVFNDAKQLSYELDCDAAKFISNDALYQLYSLDDSNTMYQINERPVSTGIVPLGIMVKNQGQVIISTSRLDRQDVILVDKVQGIRHRLSAGSYTFTSVAGTFNSRFELHVPSAVHGDVNGDSQVTISDLTALIAYLKGTTPLHFNSAAADVDLSGTVTLADVHPLLALIQNHMSTEMICE